MKHPVVLLNLLRPDASYKLDDSSSSADTATTTFDGTAASVKALAGAGQDGGGEFLATVEVVGQMFNARGATLLLAKARAAAVALKELFRLDFKNDAGVFYCLSVCLLYAIMPVCVLQVLKQKFCLKVKFMPQTINYYL